MDRAIDVVVAGAGPVGLLTAIELTLGGARVRVLERLTAPSTTLKALGVGPLGVEALQRRGMGAAIEAAEARSLAAMDRVPGQAGGGLRGAKFSGHFGFLFIRRDPQAEPDRRMRAVDQQGLEAMLIDRAAALGVDLRRGCTLTGFTEAADGVEVTWTAPAGDGRVRCAYLVGCDGGRSAVRKMAGFAFPGTPPTLTMYQAIADLDDPAGALPVGWHRGPGGVFGHGPFPRRLFMLDFSGPPADRQAPVTRDEIETVLRRVSGTDVRVAGVEAANRWADNTRLVDTYRRGRVLLAGDAAHVHAPFGGQGLSLGLGDAANLGWKLAAVLRGEMPESLLDTYTAERRPVAEAVTANTRAQAAILRPDPQSGALRDLMARLLESDEVSRILGSLMRGLSARYDLGSAEDAVGRMAGDGPLGPGGATLYGAMQDGRGLLVDGSADGAASRMVAAATGRVTCVAVPEGPSMLVRHDGCIAWTGAAHALGGLREAVSHWFGPSPGAPLGAPAPMC
ncbi:FAD-binding monooxygenase [Methylobacterium radiotolerans]|nr:FAD-binding monooxygenase [Methylobacterium radiotolerans]KTS51029.1 FAD-binding monooxygenase [Methylobacterium radiotolerans]